MSTASLASRPVAARAIHSLIGPLCLRARDGALVGIDLPAPPTEEELALWAARPPAAGKAAVAAVNSAATARLSARSESGAFSEDPRDARVLDQAARELGEYFRGARRAFSVPLAPEGTPFQRLVWKALLEIPYGETRSYADIALALGKPTASRAVGGANGRNPIAVIVPCHRVIASGGGIGGYGGGLPMKRRLLELERGGER